MPRLLSLTTAFGISPRARILATKSFASDSTLKAARPRVSFGSNETLFSRSGIAVRSERTEGRTEHGESVIQRKNTDTTSGSCCTRGLRAMDPVYGGM